MSAKEIVNKHDFSGKSMKNINDVLDSINMNWDVEAVEIMTTNGINIPSNKAMVRNDNNRVLGVVGNRYELVQNASAFSLMDLICQQHGAEYSYLYEINGGKKVVIQAKIPGKIEITKSDILDRYITMINSFDGSTAVMAYFTTVRLVCNNRLNASLRNATDKVSIRHTRTVDTKIQEAMKIWGMSQEYFDVFQNNARKLTQKNIDKKMVNMFLEEVFGKPDSTKMKNTHREVENLFQRGMGNHGNTAWDLYNGATEYIDHHRGSDDEKRLSSSLIGSGATIKEKAFSVAMSM